MQGVKADSQEQHHRQLQHHSQQRARRASPVPLNGHSLHAPTPASSHSSRGAGVALSAAIREAASWDELADLYDSAMQQGGGGGGFRSGHVSAALARLPHLRGACLASPAAAAAVAVVADGHQLPLPLDGARRVDAHVGPGAAAINGTTTSTSSTTSTTTIATRASDSGVHGSGCSRHEALLAALLADFNAHTAAGAYGSRELSSCAWVLGRLGRRERADLVGELVDRMLPALGEEDEQEEPGQSNGSRRSRGEAGGGQSRTGAVSEAPEAGPAAAPTVLDLSNAALGMARLGVTRPELWQRLAAAAAPRLQHFGTQELSNLVWSFAQAHRAACRLLPARPPPPQPASEARPPPAPDALHPDWAPWLRPFVQDAAADRARRVLRRCTAQEAANLVWSLATLGHADARTVKVVAAEAATRAGSLTPQGVSMTAWALATMVANMRTSNMRDDECSAGIASGSSEVVDGSELSSIDDNNDTGSSSDCGTAGTAVRARKPSPAEQAAAATAEAAKAAVALAAAAKGRIWCYSAQGLSNLLWALRGLGSPARKALLTAAAREAVVRLQDQLSPLGLATLLGEWAAAGLYHPGLFAAVAPAALERLSGFRPGTLVRLLAAYGAVGCCERQLFLAAADLLLGTGTSTSSGISEGADATGARGAAQRRPLDGLSRGECFQLVCAYGQVGVHVPQLIDAALARMVAPGAASPPGAAELQLHLELPPRAACRLAAALALLGHRPAQQAPGSGGGDAVDSPCNGVPSVPALRGVMLDLRRLLLPALPSLEPVAAVTAVWALMRLDLAGPAAAVRLGELLVRRCGSASSFAAASAASGGGHAGAGGAARGALAAAVANVTRTAATVGDGRMLARLLWVLGRGAAAALQQQKDLQRQQQVVVAGSAPEASSALQAAAAARELSAALLAAVMVLVEERPEALARTPEALAAAAAALSEVLATAAPRAAQPPARGRGRGSATAAPTCSVPDVELREALVEVCEQAFRRASAASAAPAGERAAGRRGPKRRHSPQGQQAQAQAQLQMLSDCQLAEVVRALCVSGVAEQEPVLRQAAARAVARRLVALVEAAAAGGTAAASAPPAALSDEQAGDLAALLVAAARLQLFGQPAALPVLRAAAQMLAAAGRAAAPRPVLSVVQLPQLLALLRCDPAVATATCGGCAPEAPAVQAALYTFVLRQAMPLLPWLPDAAAAQALADARRLPPSLGCGGRSVPSTEGHQVRAVHTAAATALVWQQGGGGSSDAGHGSGGGEGPVHTAGTTATSQPLSGAPDAAGGRQCTHVRHGRVRGGPGLRPEPGAEVAVLPGVELHVRSGGGPRVAGDPAGTVILVRPDGAHGRVGAAPGGRQRSHLAA
eukprot:XP_001699901.1 predicted protein [Chlamydomonas reinhardtii]